MKFFLTLFTLLSLSTGALAQDTQAQAILDKLSAKIKSYSSFYIEFSAHIKSSDGTESTVTGKGWVKGKKYSATYGENTVISNGLKTWTIVKEEKTVYEADADDDDEESINPKKLMTIWETGFKNRYSKEMEMNDETVHVIYLYPKNAGNADYHTVILYISKAKNELKKAVMKMKDGTVMTYRLSKLNGNLEIDDAIFVYDANKYPGYKLFKDY
jgi:outer membrane lipoprotein-sorting protein